MNDSGNKNFSFMLKYYIFTAIAISLAANGVITDMLLLKMDFDLDKLGVIKGHIYFLPAVSYFLAAPLLHKLNRDIQICQWGYFLRCLFPLALPVLALTCANKTVLLWTTATIFAISYSCAMFANNTLLKVMHQALPPEKLNREAMFLIILPSIPCSLISIAAAWWLNRVGASTTTFMLWLAGMQLFCLLFEYPANRAIGRVKLLHPPQNAGKKMGLLSFRSISKNCWILLGVTLIHGIWLGLCATYFVIYLLKVKMLPPYSILWIEFALCLIITAVAPLFGKIADKTGYPPVFTFCTLLMAIVAGAWSLAPSHIWLLVCLIVLIYNGNTGLLSNLLKQSESVASIRLAFPGTEEYTVGLGTLISSVASFCGCTFAGMLYNAVGGSLENYLRWCCIGPAILFLASAMWFLSGFHKTNEFSRR